MDCFKGREAFLLLVPVQEITIVAAIIQALHVAGEKHLVSLQEKASLWTYITEPEDIDDDSEGSQEVAAQALESAELADSDAAVGAELHEGSSAASGKASKLPHQAYDMYKR